MKKLLLLLFLSLGLIGSAYAYDDAYNALVNGDYQKAFVIIKPLAEQNGDVWSQNNLGMLYREGEGVVKNYEQAVYWFTKAAEQGGYLAQYNLAQIMV